MKADLRAELLRRTVLDQEARWAHDSAAMERADSDNLPWIRQVIAEHGWPGRSDVGDDGAQAAWLLVQHADADPAFQRDCLGLLTSAVGQGEARRSHLALLTDRVLVAEGQPQEYGTQLRYRDGECVPFRCVIRSGSTSAGRRWRCSRWPTMWPSWRSRNAGRRGRQWPS